MGANSDGLDVIILGGGVNGTGVLRDLTLRGYRAALLEQNDLGFGASGNSSGMIHGGPRYMTADPHVTYTSCLDSGHIQRIAPHLLFRVPFLAPVFGKGLFAYTELLTYDAFFRAYDRYQDLKRSKKHLTFNAEEVRTLEPGLIETGGAVSFDEWGVDGVRLCVMNVLDATSRGALYLHRTSVTELLRSSSGHAVGVRFLNRENGESGTLLARLVVNATGGWSNATSRLLGLATPSPLVRPGKGIHVYLDRRVSNFAIVTNAVDGRQVFLLPWQNMSVLGTTDTDYYGDPNQVVANRDEVGYLFEAIARVFPTIRKARAIGTWGGLRPTIYSYGPPPDRLSRDHRLVDHSADGTAGLYSMIGGKLASYRLFSEETVDELARVLGKRGSCQTASLALPGGEETPDEAGLAEDYGIERLTARRLVYRHGSRAKLVLAEAREHGESCSVVCPCEPVTEAEVRYVVRHEWATSVSDISRRTRLGQGACGGLLCAKRAGELLSEVTGAPPTVGRESARTLLTEAALRRAGLASPDQLPTERLLKDRMKLELGWEHPLWAGDEFRPERP